MTGDRWDLAIVGGGPAGLATAIHAARAGFRVTVLERQAGPQDKACGEGLMPQGLRALEELGALALVDCSCAAPFRGILYAQEDGRSVAARFTRGDGLGLRRTALTAALAWRATALGATLSRCSVRGLSQDGAGLTLDTDRGPVRARLVVGADGLQSQLRTLAGLALEPPAGPRRYGLRRHFARPPWSDLVEVHWAAGLECYVTPVGPALVNVAFLWDSPLCAAPGGPSGHQVSFDALLARFPAVQGRVLGAPTASESRGAGPLLRPVRARVAPRLALVGDAAGYVDAITGQGLSLAFLGAAELVRALPRALDGAPLDRALQQYERALRGAWRRYELPAQALLWVSRRPALRRALLGMAARAPRLFSRALERIAA